MPKDTQTTDAKYPTQQIARIAYICSADYTPDLNAWAIDQISKYGAASFVRNTHSTVELHRHYTRSDTFATAVDDIYNGDREVK